VILTEGATGSYFEIVRSVGLKVLKNKLSEYVRLAAQGETVLVTDRDRVVAEIGPPAAGRGEWASDVHLATLVRDGILRPPLLPRGTVPPRRPVAPTEDILRELSADRDR
jgi:antitoxin (DNA-binding transcriptional repressor) of toxin-antitoxin stability system